MDNLPPISSPIGAPAALSPAVNADVIALVNARKWVLLALFTYILLIASVLVCWALLSIPNMPSDSPLVWIYDVMRYPIKILPWGILMGVPVSVWNLGQALRIKLAWLWGLISFLFSLPLLAFSIPAFHFWLSNLSDSVLLVLPASLLLVCCIPPAMLLFLRWQAKRELKIAGYRVGIWGAKIN
ncbi:hypothetical protein EON83_08245 [bacterium]|nr:MAG: hypothetical protein EON83_08245 [bacterium]